MYYNISAPLFKKRSFYSHWKESLSYVMPLNRKIILNKNNPKIIIRKLFCRTSKSVEVPFLNL